MAAGLTYKQVRAEAFPDGCVKPTRTGQIRRIMSIYGVQMGARLIPFHGKHPKCLGFDALVKINPRKNGREWHWVIWDHLRQEILDPKRPPYRRRRFISYVRLDIPPSTEDSDCTGLDVCS